MDVLIFFKINEPAIDSRRSISYLTYSSMWCIYIHIFHHLGPRVWKKISIPGPISIHPFIHPPFQVMVRSYPCPWVFLLPQHHWSPWTALQLSGAGEVVCWICWVRFSCRFCLVVCFNFFWWSIYYLVNLSLWKLAVKYITCIITELFLVAFCGVIIDFYNLGYAQIEGF